MSEATAAFAGLLADSLRRAGGEGEPLRAASAALSAALAAEEDEGRRLASALHAAGAVAALQTALLALHPRDSHCCESVCTALAAVLEAQPAAAPAAVGATGWLVSTLTARQGLGAASCAAAAALSALLNSPGAAGERARATAFASRCMPPLVKMLGGDAAAAAAGAAALAACVCEHAGSAIQMCDEGGLPCVLTLLAGAQADPEAAFFAAAAVGKGASAGGFAVASAAEAAGLPAALAAAAKAADGHLLVRLEALKALASLAASFAAEADAWPSASQSAAKTAGLVSLEALVKLVGAPAGRDYALEATLAATQLLRLRPPTGEPGVRAAVQLLSRMLASSGAAEEVDAPLGAACCSALNLLPMDADLAAELVNAAGAFDATLAILGVAGAGSATEQRREEERRSCALSAAVLLQRLLAVCRPPPPAEAAAAAAEPLCALLRTDAGAVLNAQAALCAAALANGGLSGAEALRAAGAIPLLALLLRDGARSGTGEAAALATASMAREGGWPCSRALTAAQAVPALLALCVELPGSAAAAHAVRALGCYARDGGEEALDELEACDASVGLTSVASGAPHRSEAAQQARQTLALLDARIAQSFSADEDEFKPQERAGSAAERAGSAAGSREAAAPPAPLFLPPLRPRQFAPRLPTEQAAGSSEAQAPLAQLEAGLSEFSLWDQAAETAVRNDAARRDGEIARLLQQRSHTELALAEAQAWEQRLSAELRQLRQSFDFAAGMQQRSGAAAAEALAALHSARLSGEGAAHTALLEARAESTQAKAEAAANAARAAGQRVAPAEAALQEARGAVQMRLVDAEACAKAAAKVAPPPAPTRRAGGSESSGVPKGVTRVYRR